MQILPIQIQNPIVPVASRLCRQHFCSTLGGYAISARPAAALREPLLAPSMPMHSLQLHSDLLSIVSVTLLCCQSWCMSSATFAAWSASCFVPWDPTPQMQPCSALVPTWMIARRIISGQFEHTMDARSRDLKMISPRRPPLIVGNLSESTTDHAGHPTCHLVG